MVGDSMLKIEKEYRDQYGMIPISQNARLNILLKNLKKKKRREKRDLFKEIQRIDDIKWNTYKFIVWLVPRATPRPRINKSTQLFYVFGSDINKKLFKKFMKENPHETIYTPMSFTTDVYIPTPKSLKPDDMILAEMGVIRPISKPDFDNVAKTYSDMIQGTLIYDDSLIIEGISRKFYSIKPRIEITIKYMDDFDCLFNRKKIESKLSKINKERNEESS